MFGLGVWEIAVIAVVALLVLGPDKLPSAAKSLGKALRDFRRAGDDIKQQMMGDVDEPVRPPPKIAVQKPEGQVDASPEPPPPAEPSADPKPHG
ncbi:MAG: twin-arginine translocase TatA/TatE family subunit [Deltaproteobacteria bacterium]|nr:twin-arginine translocase TatA/TatE family subunit [Deltaproteobacteria bacterium]